MKRKLLVLDVILLALTALFGSQLRQAWLEARAREERVLKQAVRPAPAPPLTPLKPPSPVTAAAYIDIAQKALTFKDRNPNVIIEPVAPPPPPIMPPLPAFFGVMNLGDGPSAILSEKAGAQNREYKTGQQVGAFKLTAIHDQDVVLEWEGKTIVRQIERLSEAPAAEPAERAAENRRPAPVAMRQTGPGVDIGRGVRACQANDSTPAGAVVDGLRKVLTETPFGKSCRWEPVQ